MSSSDMRVNELWAELGAAMRALRASVPLSLRQVELRGSWGRGTLSQVENGKSRPTFGLVEWYDEQFGADGLLVTLFIEASGWDGRSDAGVPSSVEALPGDEFTVASACVPSGQLARPGEDLKVGWTIVNAGTVPWRGRQLRRVGAIGSSRVIASRRTDPLPDCAPGEAVDAHLTITTPARRGTVCAYWEIVDADGRPCFPGRPATDVLLVVA